MPEFKFWRPGDLDPTSTEPPVRYRWPHSLINWNVPIFDSHGNEQPDLHDTAPGIRIVTDMPEYRGMTGISGEDLSTPENFAAYTVMCLRLLYTTDPGAFLIDHLINNSQVTIEYSPAQNACRGAQLYISVATELLNPAVYTTAPVGRLVETLAAVGRKYPAAAVNVACNSLSDEVNRICGGQDLDLTATHGAGGMNPNTTGDEIRNWLTTGWKIMRLPDMVFKKLALAMIVVLERHSTPSIPSEASVSFCTSTANALNTQRPPAIGLFHELVHAYWYACGKQPGRDFGHFSTTLFEFKCVGIGPWRNGMITENIMRGMWAGVVARFGDQIDDLNNRQVVPRLSY